MDYIGEMRKKDIEYESRGFSRERTKRSRKFLDCHAHFRHVNAFVTHVIIVATHW